TSVRFRKDLIREGSGHLRDGRTVAYDRRLHGTNRFRIVQSEFGIGKFGCALVPYRTVAVDPHFIRLGTTISIPQLKGTPLPDGTIHDGIFVANDRGHFHGPHIDIFAGISTDDRSRSRIDERPRSFMVRIISERRISIARATPAAPAAPRP